MVIFKVFIRALGMTSVPLRRKQCSPSAGAEQHDLVTLLALGLMQLCRD